MTDQTDRVVILALLKALVGEFKARARQHALPAADQNDPIRGAAAMTWSQAARDVDALIEDIEI